MSWVAPRNWVPGEFVTATMMNTLRDNLLYLKTQLDADEANIAGLNNNWAAYSPTWYNGDAPCFVVDGTISGTWVQHNKTVHARIVLTIGASTGIGTSTGANEFLFGLPVICYMPGGVLGSASVFDASGNSNTAGVTYLATTTQILLSYGVNQPFVSATSPNVTAVGDIYSMNMTYATP